jgi:hypothetical protein
MADILFEDEEKVQTNKFRLNGSGESRSGTHNPKVVGSSPAPATKKRLIALQSGVSVSYRFLSLHHDTGTILPSCA